MNRTEPTNTQLNLIKQDPTCPLRTKSDLPGPKRSKTLLDPNLTLHDPIGPKQTRTDLTQPNQAQQDPTEPNRSQPDHKGLKRPQKGPDRPCRNLWNCRLVARQKKLPPNH
jgi:hypothetical protein